MHLYQQRFGIKAIRYGFMFPLFRKVLKDSQTSDARQMMKQSHREKGQQVSSSHLLGPSEHAFGVPFNFLSLVKRQ